MTTNNHRCFCELAPLYALDLLDPEERSWVEAQIVDCPDLAEELAGYQAAVATIPYGATPAPMAADLKDRLFESLGLDLEPPTDTPTPPSLEPEMTAIRAADLDWRPHRIPGVDCAVLYIDRVARMRTLMVKAAAGVVYPIHQHGGVEEIFMLEGELEIAGQIYGAGDYIRSRPNSIHAPSTDTGCKFIIRASMDDLYDENLRLSV
jgi:anti-sigma factor ChrR (cupin superfamily)